MLARSCPVEASWIVFDVLLLSVTLTLSVVHVVHAPVWGNVMLVVVPLTVRLPVREPVDAVVRFPQDENALAFERVEIPAHGLTRRGAVTWMPHSLLSSPRQRPARKSSPGATRSVQV